MNTRIVTLTCTAMLLAACPAWGGSDDTNPPPQALRLEIALADGSRLRGVPRIESLLLQTDYARMEIPLKQIVSVKVGDDHETAFVTLLNGDQLKGVLALKPFELTTLFGTIKIGVEQLRELAVTSGEGLASILARGLFSYYSFDKDEGGKIADKSGNGHDGTVNGAVWTPDGKVGGACRFRGNSYVNIGYQPAGTDLTLSVWIKPANTGLGFFLGTHFVETSLWMLTVEGPHGPPRQCARIGYDTAAGGESLFGTSNVQDGQWHHIAATIDSKGAKLYVDGVLENQNTVPGRWQGGHAALGRSLTGSPGFYSGLIDEVMIFHRPLSAAEIKQIYETQKRGSSLR